jgi:hypothetical protein
LDHESVVENLAMNVIVISGPLREQLMSVDGTVELRDEEGNLLGCFIPPQLEIPELDLTEEEIARRLAPDAKTYTTAEVLAHMKGLGT